MCKRVTLTLGCIFLAIGLYAQSISCPSNLDFELGNFTNWKLYTGSCCPINTPTLSGPVATRHTVTTYSSAADTDFYGGFPIVAPGGGSHSLKLGNANVAAQAERARYYIKVPAGVNNYSVIFRYAVVFEDPGHIPAEQPRFEVKAFDSVTNSIINCSQFTYISTASLPGFTLSPWSATYLTDIYYKSWTTASVDLSGSAGRTVCLEFSSGDCDQGGHFGYGYVDMNCGLFQIQTVLNCDTSSTITLTGPPGFASYSWRDSAAMGTVITTGQIANIAKPSTTKTYAVILTPYTGFGCPDTLYTTVKVSNLTVNAGKDTSLCNGASIALNASATATDTPITYTWAPSNGLSCTTCKSPTATVSATSTYYVTAKDSKNCTKTDTVKINVSTLAVNASNDTTVCGSSSVQLSAGATGNFAPITYTWSPATNLSCTTCANPVSTATTNRTYYVTVKDTLNCTKNDSVKINISNPTLTLTKQDVKCFNTQNGSISVAVNNGKSPYTYSWNTSPAKTTQTITNLDTGKYIVTMTDSNGCKAKDSAVIAQPAILTASVTSTTGATCYGGSNGSATVSATGGKGSYSYSWNTSPAKNTATVTGLSAGTYIVTVTDSNGCTDTAIAIIGQPAPVNASIDSTSQVSCNGGNNGIAVVAASGGTPSYTYSWNTSPAQNSATTTGLSAGVYIVTVTDSKGCTDTAIATISQSTSLSATISSSTMVSCNGGNNGTASVSATGGTSPFSYSWNTSPSKTTSSVTGLSAGIYTVTVTDANNCQAFANISITEPALLNATIGGTNNVSCYGGNNGTTTVAVTGGTTSYSYNWNTNPVQTTATATGLGAGTYTVTVTDAKGCTDTALATITQPAAVNAIISSTTNAICGNNNGSAVVSAGGGTPSYTFSWNTSPAQTTATATGLSAGAYIVTVTDSKGCIDTAHVTVSQSGSLVATISATTNISCNGGSNGAASVSVNSGTPPYTYNWNTTPAQTTSSIVNLTAGSYIVTVTDVNGCSDTALAVITQPAVLNATISATTPVNCNGGSNGTATAVASGGNSPYSFSWNTTPAQTTATATGLSANDYIVTVTDSKGCIDTAHATIVEPLVLNASVTGTTSPVCYNGNNGTATATATGGNSPYTYSWNTTPVKTGANATGLAAGTYTVTVTDNKGCTDTAHAIVIQPTQVIVAIPSFTNANCHGAADGAATATASGGISPYSYSWNTSPVKTGATATGLSAGTYIVTATDSKGCSNTASVTIGQPAALNATISTKTNAVCNGDNNGSATVAAVGGTSPYSYSWNTSPAQIMNAAINLAAGTYIATVTDSKGCIDTAIAIITQPAAVNASATVTNVGCNGGNNGSAIAAVSGGTPSYSYSWNTSPVQTTAAAASLSAGSYLLTVKDSKGCIDTATIIVNEPAVLSAKITAVTNVKCNAGSDGSATVSVSGGSTPYNYSWNTTPPQTGTTATGLAAGTYTVTITDKNGCITNTSAILTQPAPFTINASPLKDICIGATDGEATGSVSGGVQPYTYNWSTTPAQTTLNATNMAPGTYTFVATDAQGCSASANVTINTYPKMDLEATGGGTLCEKQSVQLWAKGAKTYKWFDAATLSCSTCVNPVAHPSNSTTYQVIGIDSNSCMDSATVSVEIIKRKPTSVGGDHEICEGTAAKLAANGGVEYTWSPATYLDDPNRADPTSNAKETIKYRVIIKQNECFTDTLYQTVTVHAYPTIELGPDIHSAPGEVIQLNAVTTNASSITWKPETGLSCTDCFAPKATVQRTTTYRATVTNGPGCEASDNITIHVSCDASVVFVPNTFTPNGDGLNDVFIPSSKGITNLRKMTIYNRWGQVVFQATNIPTNDVQYGWDGTFKNEKLTPDVYVYMIEANCITGEPIFIKGDISLIR